MLCFHVAQTGKHLLRTQNVSKQNQKHFLCPDTKFVSATNVERAGKRGNICVGNNNLSFLNFRLNRTELIFVEQLRSRTRRRRLRPFTKQDQKKTTPAETNPAYKGLKLRSKMFHDLDYF